MTSKSELDAVPTPPVSESSLKRSETDQDIVVSETMREEEKKMQSASAKEEENRIRKAHAESREEDGLDGTAVDERFLKLDRLLSQSKVGLLCYALSLSSKSVGLAKRVTGQGADTSVV